MSSFAYVDDGLDVPTLEECYTEEDALGYRTPYQRDSILLEEITTAHRFFVPSGYSCIGTIAAFIASFRRSEFKRSFSPR